MSIYATMHEIGFWPWGFYDKPITVTMQSVPSHIGHPEEYPEGDPYGSFLPPPAIDPDGDIPRAMVIVREGRETKDGQRYVDPIATIPGDVWVRMTFSEVMRAIEDGIARQDAQDAASL